MTEPNLTIGIEEEYILIDPASRDAVPDPPASMMKVCQERLGERVTGEFMRCQVEVDTAVCSSIKDLRDELVDLRGGVHRIATEHDLSMVAVSTHPFANWSNQAITQRERYMQMESDIGVPLRRLLICAMHIHVGIEDEALRIDLMNQVRYFLPHLLALSTSSPFWQGRETGLKSYRMAVFNEMPRTGMPETFDSWGDYVRHRDELIGAGAINDPTKIWWDLRPSARFPTLELRICDICTNIDDAISIASIYRSLLRALWRLRRNNTQWRQYRNMMINENRWRAMRYGMQEGLIDFGKGRLVPYEELLAELLDLIAEDAAELDCARDVEHAPRILERGTSADWQLATFRDATAKGAEPAKALTDVVDTLAAETIKGV